MTFSLVKLKPAYLFLLFLSMVIVSCSKKGSDPAPPVDNTPKVTITSLSVNTGVYDTEVVITGTNFSATLADDQVFFNGKAATVSAATATKLTVKVPLAAGSGAVSVKVSGGTAITGPTFTYQQSWLVSTFAGGSTYGYADGAAADAKFFTPSGLAFDAAGNLIVSENGNNDIRKIATDGIVSTVAGSRRTDKNDGKGTEASFYGPTGLAIDPAGNIYVADYYNDLIRKIDPSNNVTTFAGGGNGLADDGKGAAASFFGPADIKIDGSGNFFVADLNNELIRKITPDANVGTFSKVVLNPKSGTRYSPVSLAFDKDYNLYVSLELGYNIQKISATGVISTLAGNGLFGTTDGQGSSARFARPYGLAVDKDGNIYVADFHRIRKITPAGQVTTFAGFEVGGFANGPATKAFFNNIAGIAIDKLGNIFVADSGNQQIRKIAFE